MVYKYSSIRGTLRWYHTTYDIYFQVIIRRCSVTIFLTDFDGTVTQHDGNFLAVDGFPFLDGTFLAVDGQSNFDGIFTAVTQHDGKFLAVDCLRFLTVSFWR